MVKAEAEKMVSASHVIHGALSPRKQVTNLCRLKTTIAEVEPRGKFIDSFCGYLKLSASLYTTRGILHGKAPENTLWSLGRVVGVFAC